MKLQSAYNQAPELLLDEVAVLTTIIEEIKVRRGDNDYSKKLEHIRASILLALNYFEDLEFIHNHAQEAEIMNKMLKQYCADLQKQLQRFEVVESLVLSGQLEKTIETVNRATTK